MTKAHGQSSQAVIWMIQWLLYCWFDLSRIVLKLSDLVRLAIILSHLGMLNMLLVDSPSQVSVDTVSRLVHRNDVTQRVVVLSVVLAVVRRLLRVKSVGLSICHTVIHFLMSDFLGILPTISSVRIDPFGFDS